jgi:hypothetical protein
LTPQGVDAAEAFERCVGDPACGSGVGNVSGHGEQVRFFGRLDRAGAGYYRPVPPAVPGDQAGADALRGAGDDGDLAWLVGTHHRWPS